jgi:hypothetical protein
MKKFVSRWLDVFDVYKSMPDELYKETDADWTHHLPVEWLICVIIISDKNLYNTTYVSISGCEGRKMCLFMGRCFITSSYCDLVVTAVTG